MEIIFDTNGGVAKWLWKQPNIEEADLDVCVGWKEGNMKAAVGLQKIGDECYIYLVSKTNKFWSRKNLTFIANVCYNYLNCKEIISLSSISNDKIHSVLDRLGFRRKEITLDGRQLFKSTLTSEDIKTKKWYYGGLNGK